jgi:VWFA-related protein
VRTGPRGLLTLSFALLAPAAGMPQAPPRDPSFPAAVEIVTVDVEVRAGADEPVLGLAREDFQVTEDGVAQEIVAFEAVHRPAPPAPAPGAPAPPPPLEPRTSSNRLPSPRVGSHFVVVFDELHLDPAEAVRARAAVTEFFSTGLADGDYVALVGTGVGTRWAARFPQGREDLLRVLARLQGKRVGERVRDAMTEYEAMRIHQDRDPIVTDRVMRRLLASGEIRRDVSTPREPVDTRSEVEGWRNQTQALAAQVYARTAGRTEQTLGIVERSLEALGEARGRKSLLLVSGGLVQDSRLSGYRRVVTEARRAHTAISSVDVRGLVAAPSGLQADVAQPADLQDRSTGIGLTETQEGGEGSEGLALDTGGSVLRNRNDLGAGLARIAREGRSYYLLGYSPSNRAADGRFRRIDVEVARPGIRVRARRGYYAPGADEKAAKPEGRDAAIQRALDAPFDLPGVPLRALAQVFGEAGSGQASVVLTLEVDVRLLAFAVKDGKAHDTLETLLVVAHRGTGDYTRFDHQFEMAFPPERRAEYERTWFPIRRDLKLAPGPYQARIVARDRNNGRVGSLSHDFDVPAPGAFRLSSLVLSDRLRDDPGAASRMPELIARRSFAPSGVLHCRFEVYGALGDPKSGPPNVTAGFALRRSDGRVLAAAPETPVRPGPDGSLARSLGVPLDGAPPGRYEVIVLATDLAAGRTAEMREPLVIEARPED